LFYNRWLSSRKRHRRSAAGSRQSKGHGATRGAAQRAMWSYERFHSLPRGSATLQQVRASSAGLRGWASASSFSPFSSPVSSAGVDLEAEKEDEMPNIHGNGDGDASSSSSRMTAEALNEVDQAAKALAATIENLAEAQTATLALLMAMPSTAPESPPPPRLPPPPSRRPRAQPKLMLPPATGFELLLPTAEVTLPATFCSLPLTPGPQTRSASLPKFAQSPVQSSRPQSAPETASEVTTSSFTPSKALALPEMLPARLPLVFSIDRFTVHRGYLGGQDLYVESMTVSEAKSVAASLPGCRGFMYFDPFPPARGAVRFHFKDRSRYCWPIPGWTSFRCGSAMLPSSPPACAMVSTTDKEQQKAKARKNRWDPPAMMMVANVLSLFCCVVEPEKGEAPDVRMPPQRGMAKKMVAPRVSPPSSPRRNSADKTATHVDTEDCVDRRRVSRGGA